MGLETIRNSISESTKDTIFKAIEKHYPENTAGYTPESKSLQEHFSWLDDMIAMAYKNSSWLFTKWILPNSHNAAYAELSTLKIALIEKQTNFLDTLNKQLSERPEVYDISNLTGLEIRSQPKFLCFNTSERKKALLAEIKVLEQRPECHKSTLEKLEKIEATRQEHWENTKKGIDPNAYLITKTQKKLGQHKKYHFR